MITRDETTYNLQAQENIVGNAGLTRHQKRNPYGRDRIPSNILQKNNSCSDYRFDCCKMCKLPCDQTPKITEYHINFVKRLWVVPVDKMLVELLLKKTLSHLILKILEIHI